MEWSLRELWMLLTVIGRLYILCLLAAAAYTAYFLVRVVSRLRSLGSLGTDSLPSKSHLLGMTGGIEELRQLHFLLLLLFGVSLANEILAAFRAFTYASMSLSGASIGIFVPLAMYAFLVLVVLAFLHISQWIVAARLRRAVSLEWPEK
jgi:hypothetical protein